MTSIVQQHCHIIERLTKKTGDWTRLSCFGSEYEEEEGELLAKNIARTARRQLGGRHLQFGEYLQN